MNESWKCFDKNGFEVIIPDFETDKNVKTSSWIEKEHTSFRTIEGTDPEDLKNRIAFIEKTPRIRIAPYGGDYDYKNWIFGPKGSGGGDPRIDQTYGFDSDSRNWCDLHLQRLGYILG